MENKRPALQTYTPAQLAVLPGSTARGLVLGLVYTPLFSLVYHVAAQLFDGTSVGSFLTEFQTEVGWGGIAGIGFMLPVAVVLVLAWLGYRRRSYEIGPEGVTERRGILLRTERHLTYDKFEGVTVTETFVQSLYGAGTVLLTDINQAEDEQVVMKMSFVRNPEDVSTNILRQITDMAETETGDLDSYNVDELDVESESISRLSSDALAAGTGFEYMMPSAILHPRPWEAAKYGFERGIMYSAIGGAIVLYYFRGFVMNALDLPSTVHVVGITCLSAVVFSLLVAGRFYSLADDIQYELYDDHIKFIKDEKTTSFSLHDVHQIRTDTPGLTDISRPWSDVGHIELLDETGDAVIVFKYIANCDGVFGALDDWLQMPDSEESPE